MAIKLIVKSDKKNNSREEYVLDDLVISVGRSQSCTVVLLQREVSRRHFVVKFENGTYFIVDEGSTHGTWLDDEKLEPGKNYVLSTSQIVKIPGVTIELFNDHKPPRTDKTTLVARKLMGELFEDFSMKEEVSFLFDITHQKKYFFNSESSSFILGRASHLDFVVDDEAIKKEHLSFARDINGTRVIVINNAQLIVNDELIKDSTLLYHGDLISIGETQLCFFEREDQKRVKELLLKHSTQETKQDEKATQIIEPEDSATKEEYYARRSTVLKGLDYLFFVLFIIFSCGLSWLWLKMT
ncbi:MAG: FHA domain-containing protein [Myxococcales bacterium]|nr:FHA domain-containing protein [Myxococcales bacterium]USN51346.1 MAG: FHA domain-containing protein [Myxococcales bacterium]